MPISYIYIYARTVLGYQGVIPVNPIHTQVVRHVMSRPVYYWGMEIHDIGLRGTIDYHLKSILPDLAICLTPLNGLYIKSPVTLS